MAKKVYITRRSVAEGKVFGKGGEYTVSDKLARVLVRQNRCQIVKDLGSDPETPETQALDSEFMDKVRDNISQIFDLINEEYDRREQLRIRGEEEAQSGFETAGESSTDDQHQESEAEAPAGENEDEDPDENQEQAPGGESETQTPAPPLPSEESGAQNSEDNREDNKPSIREDYPGREALIAAGILHEKDVPTDREELMKVPGIKQRLANQIEVYRKQNPK